MSIDMLKDLAASITKCETLGQLDEIRVSIFGKKGLLTKAMQELSILTSEAKKEKGKDLNETKQALEKLLTEKRAEVIRYTLQKEIEASWGDISLESRSRWEGKLHPLTRTQEQIFDFFGERGFQFAQGPQIESQDNNFTLLNIPSHHPARQSLDTFYLEKINPHSLAEKLLLRTHTSTVQIRQMKVQQPPFRLLSVGPVYRSDYDATHTPMFHQLEGLVVEENIDMGHLKGILADFLAYFFDNKNLKLRFRPSYFPFTEPSAEVDIGYSLKDGEIKLGGDEKWLEVLGCGMVHPFVLSNCGIDPERHRGFAFGLGLERITMLRSKTKDLRAFFEGDLRWLSHFGASAFFKPLLGQGDI